MLKFLEGNKLLIILIASEPLKRISPMAPMPGGVANATMVSFQPDNFKLIEHQK
jgi:hypothetical protein